MTRVVAVTLLVLAGCDQLFQLDRVREPTGTMDARGDGPAVDAPPGCFFDEFPGPDIHPWWDPYAPVMPSVVNGRLRMDLIGDQIGNTYGGVRSEPQAMTGLAADVEVVPAIAAVGTEIYMVWLLDQQNHYMFQMRSGALEGVLVQGGTRTDVFVDLPYDPVAHRYWRLTHDAVGKKVGFWTRGEATGWIMQGAVDAALPLDPLEMELGGGTFTDVENPGTIEFDHFRLCTP